jgi:hypothetical protein
MRWFSLLIGSALVLASCKSNKPTRDVATTNSGAKPASPKKHSEAIVNPAEGSTGKVVLVNPNARYVVLSYPLGTMPAAGERLHVYRAGLKVAELKVTGPTRDTNTVADITTGDCQPGDVVKEK